MNRSIEKKEDISHPSLDILKNYFENSTFDFKNFIPVTNFTIYKKSGIERLNKNVVENLKNSLLKNYINENIIDEIYNVRDYLVSKYDINIIWFMTYMPKAHLEFHIDNHSNRHIINIYDNDRFFNYESTNHNFYYANLYTEKMKENINNIDSFNEFFINHKPQYNSVKIIKSNGIYTFGHSIHNFFNDSDKLRVNFVFELDVEEKIHDNFSNEMPAKIQTKKLI